MFVAFGEASLILTCASLGWPFWVGLSGLVFLGWSSCSRLYAEKSTFLKGHQNGHPTCDKTCYEHVNRPFSEIVSFLINW